MKLFCCLILAVCLQDVVHGSTCHKPDSMNCIVLALTSQDGHSSGVSLPDLSGKTSLQIKGGNLNTFGERLANQLGSVQKLQLGPMGLEELYLKASLLEVIASENQIHVVKFRSSLGTYLLKKLDLRKNRLKNLVGFEVLTDLSELHLEDNLLEWVDFGVFERMEDLKKLFLDRNQITKVEAMMVISLPSLEYLSLAGNRLTKLDVTRWKFEALDTWDISSNDLIYVDGMNITKQFPTLGTVMISGNEWHCKNLNDSLHMFSTSSINVDDKDERDDCNKLENICCASEEMFENNGDSKLTAIEDDRKAIQTEWSKTFVKLEQIRNERLESLTQLLNELQLKSSMIPTAPMKSFNEANFKKLTEQAKQLKESLENEIQACKSRSSSNEKTIKNMEYTILQLRKSLNLEVGKISDLRKQFEWLRQNTNKSK